MKDDIPMKPETDWLQVLGDCKDNVKIHIRPLFNTLKEPQPDLGLGAGGDSMKMVDLAAEKAIIEVILENDLFFTLFS